jgi:hypothetical protein
MDYLKTNLKDLGFEFIIPENIRLDCIDFQFKTKDWDGVKFDQGLLESSFGNNFKLIKTPVPISHLRRLPKQYSKDNWVCISVQGDGLEIYAMNLLGEREEETGFALKDLIENILKFKGPWAVVFEPDYDSELEIKQATIDDILESIKFSLTIKKRGFLYYGES